MSQPLWMSENNGSTLFSPSFLWVWGWGLNSGHRSWLQAPLPSEPSCHPLSLKSTSKSRTLDSIPIEREVSVLGGLWPEGSCCDFFPPLPLPHTRKWTGSQVLEVGALGGADRSVCCRLTCPCACRLPCLPRAKLSWLLIVIVMTSIPSLTLAVSPRVKDTEPLGPWGLGRR